MNHRVKERFYAAGLWVAQSGIHVGGEPRFDINSDMALLRDSEGRFLIPGASIAGAARNFLSRTHGSFRSYIGGIQKESQAVSLLFGDQMMSLLTALDAHCEGSAMPRVRDGVRIDGMKGTAYETAKYDFEVLPAGTKFRMQFLLILYEETPVEVLQIFHEMLAAYQNGGIRLGARTRRGLGLGRLTDLAITRFNMGNVDHVRLWLEQRWLEGESVPAIQLAPKPLNQLSIEALLRLKTSILIRSGGEEAGAPDMVHLSEEGKSLLTGTSLAGALRHRCDRIANTMCPGAAERLVASMFGPVEQRKRHPLRAGRVWVEEAALQDGGLQVQSRVKIDRFTGGAFESALFDQAPFWPADAAHHVRVCIVLDLDPAVEKPPQNEEEPLPSVDPRECALLLQAFKDLWLGDLPLGGEAGGGRGVFAGVRARFSHPAHGVLEFEAKRQDDTSLQILQGDWEAWNEVASALAQEKIHA